MGGEGVEDGDVIKRIAKYEETLPSDDLFKETQRRRSAWQNEQITYCLKS